MSRRDNSLLINDIIESADKIISYIGTMSFEQFIADSKTVDAVVRNIITTASQVTDVFMKCPGNQDLQTFDTAENTHNK